MPELDEGLIPELEPIKWWQRLAMGIGAGAGSFFKDASLSNMVEDISRRRHALQDQRRRQLAMISKQQREQTAEAESARLKRLQEHQDWQRDKAYALLTDPVATGRGPVEGRADALGDMLGGNGEFWASNVAAQRGLSQTEEKEAEFAAAVSPGGVGMADLAATEYDRRARVMGGQARATKGTAPGRAESKAYTDEELENIKKGSGARTEGRLDAILSMGGIERELIGEPLTPDDRSLFSSSGNDISPLVMAQLKLNQSDRTKEAAYLATLEEKFSRWTTNQRKIAGSAIRNLANPMEQDTSWFNPEELEAEIERMGMKERQLELIRGLVSDR